MLEKPWLQYKMKLPRKTNRYCQHCNTKTEQKIDLVSTGHKRGTLKRGGKERIRARWKWRGYGNKGKYSRRPPKQQTMKAKTTTRKVLIYTCQKCKKSSLAKKSRRVSKLVFE